MINSAVICLFCVEINRAPKIIKKFCVTSLRCKLFRKNIKCYFSVDFECDKKLLELINKWVSMIFLGLYNHRKIMKIVLPLSYHMMSLYKNFELNWKKLIYFIILN